MIVAVGASPLILHIPGAEMAVPAPHVYGKEAELAQSVVVIGGGQVGCETALHLVEQGHDVTVLEMQEKILVDASASYRNRLTRNMGYHDNLKTVTGGRCTGITAKGVAYQDSEGKEQLLPCGSVVMAAGMRPVRRMRWRCMIRPIGSIPWVTAEKAANVQKAVRAAFAAAISISLHGTKPAAVTSSSAAGFMCAI